MRRCFRSAEDRPQCVEGVRIMNHQNGVFFPLRSNVGWFQSLDLKNAISNRVKEALLVYDELYIEDGTFTAEVLENGMWAPYSPPGGMPPEQRTIEYDRDVKPCTMTIAVRPGGQPPEQTVARGKTVARFKVDYYEIFRNVATSTYDFLKFVVVDKSSFPDEARRIVQRQSRKDKSTFKGIHPNRFFRDLVVDSLNLDLVTSIMLNSAVVLDARHEDLLRRKCRLPGSFASFVPVGEEIAVHHLLSVAAPNFCRLGVEQVLELREDSLWSTFRVFVSDIVSTIRTDPGILIDPRCLADTIHKKADRALFEELKKKHATGHQLAIDLGLGLTSLIPGYGILPTLAGVAKSVHRHLQDKSGWFAFLLKLSVT